MGNLTKQNRNYMRKVVGQCSLYYVKPGVYFYLLMFFLNCLTIIIVVPIITYGCEIWGSENIDIIDKLQLRFLKYILNVNKCTCSNMVYGEVGTLPLIVNIKSRVLIFWSILIICDENNIYNTISSILHRLLLKLKFWMLISLSLRLKFVKDTLNNIGLSGIWNSQSPVQSVLDSQ